MDYFFAILILLWFCAWSLGLTKPEKVRKYGSRYYCGYVADGVFNSRQAETLYSFECSYCAGSLSGKYMAERYVRRRAET